MILLRSLVFFIFYVVTAVPFSCLAVLLWPLPFKKRYAVVSQWAKINIWFLGKTCNLHFEVEGKEHIGEQPAVIICKHQSAWETLALQAVFPPQVWVLKREFMCHMKSVDHPSGRSRLLSETAIPVRSDERNRNKLHGANYFMAL